MTRFGGRRRWFAPLRATLFALLFCGMAATSRAEGPEDSAPPAETYALAPDSSAAPSGPVTTTPEPATSSLTPEGGAAPATTVAPATAAAHAPAATTTPEASAPAPPAMEARAPAQDAAKPIKRKKPAPAKKPEPQAAAVMTIGPAKSPAPPANLSGEGARAKAELDRTDAILRPVNTKVVRSFNKKAREEFGTATARQKEARAAFGENLYARAERLTLEARGLAREIAVHLGPPEDDADYVSMSLDRTEDALKRAKEVLRESGSPVNRDQLTSLEHRQKEARRLLKEGGTRKAYASTSEVRDGVLTLLRDCDDLPVSEATAEKALKCASRSLDQAKGELGERLNAAAERLAREARAQMAKARAAFARKNYRDTLLHSKLVERNLELAVGAQRSATNRSG